MKIRIGQVFHVTSLNSEDDQNGDDYKTLTRGTHEKGADIYKGIWGYKAIKEPGYNIMRRPAIILHSNSYKEDSETTPWVDIIDPDRGYVVYNGDNRSADLDAGSSRGNKLLLSLYNFYQDPEKRIYAPPILVFTQYSYNGNVRGYRKILRFWDSNQYIHKDSTRERHIELFYQFGCGNGIIGP